MQNWFIIIINRLINNFEIIKGELNKSNDFVFLKQSYLGLINRRSLMLQFYLLDQSIISILNKSNILVLNLPLELAINDYFDNLIEWLTLNSAKLYLIIPDNVFLYLETIQSYWNESKLIRKQISNLLLFIWIYTPNFYTKYNACIKKWISYRYKISIVEPAIKFSISLTLQKLWANLVIYWILIFSITLILTKFLVILKLTSIFNKFICFVLSWHIVSIFVWFIPSLIPNIINEVIKWENLSKKDSSKTELPSMFSFKRFNKTSSTESYNFPNLTNKLTNPNQDWDLTTSTDFEDGLVIIGEVSELGFQELTHWVDWTSSLTLIGGLTFSYLTIKAIAARRWKK